MATYQLIAATGCPTGIAHTYMAQEALEQAAKRKGITIKVETHGQIGIENELTPAEIQGAEAVIIAADKDVQAERFAGKRIIDVPVSVEPKIKFTSPALRSFVSKYFPKNNVAKPVIKGGAMQAAETPAIKEVLP